MSKTNRKNLRSLDEIQNVSKNNEKINFRKFVYDWNDIHPLDLWWRKKHDIPFGSKDHLEMDFLFMRLEYEEELWLSEIKKNKADKNDKEEDKAIYGAIKENDTKNIVRLGKNQVDEEFDNLDISKY